MKQLIIAAILFMALPAFALNVACIDMKKVWENSKEIKVEKANMEKMLKKTQDELKKKEADLKALQERAMKEAQVATPEAKQAMQEEFQKKYLEFQELYQSSQKMLQEKDYTAQTSFIEKVKKLATEIAKKKGYDLVLAKDNVLYMEDKYDITQDVITVINK
jgi:outer membrane protein